MPSGICISFSKLHFPTVSKAIIPAEVPSGGRFLRKANFTIVMSFSNTTGWCGRNLAMVSGHGPNLPFHSRPVCAPVTGSLTPISRAHEAVICGYWMGPDIEDGWGYVEAAVYQV